ncbi:hypothetical protein MUP59_07485 [Candidatus Bathyarchaeota archaeon]|nr:hypothetical protein [Candidatus Bathyarchaeota archaeon]
MPGNLLDIILEELAALFEARDSINGKVDLQKSFYFMKELGLVVPFNFRWSKFGPYSYELDNFADRLVAERYMSYVGKYVKNDRAFTHIEPRGTDRIDKFFG